MHGSGAFGHIDDPADPAWSGHATDDERRGPVPLAAIVAAGVLIGVLVLTLVVQRSDDAPDRYAGRHAPLPAAVVAPPADPALVAAVEANDANAAARVTEPLPALATRPLGSGWAPAAATRSPSTSGRLVGDLAGIAPVLVTRLDALAVAIDRDIEVASGWRRHAEQVDLYRRFLSGAGNLAAVPGTSLHEAGLAADVYVDDVALASVDGALPAARGLGMHFPVAGEPWHVELVDASS